MDEREALAERFEAQRGRLRAVAHRLLGSASDAEDAVQEVWLRLGRVDAGEVDNLDGWLRTVLTRICIDMLRTRRSRREHLAGRQVPDRPVDAGPGRHPEGEALLADSVSRALLVVLDTLSPAERVALVLHDMFAVPFDQIAPILERTPAATKKLASRARHKVQGNPAVPTAVLDRHRRVVAAFLTAARAGDLPAVLAVLAPDVVRRADPAVLPPGVPAVLRGARAVAEGTVVMSAGAHRAELALVDGWVGIVLAPGGRLKLAITVTVEADRIAAYEVVADPARLGELEIAVLDPPGPVRPHARRSRGRGSSR